MKDLLRQYICTLLEAKIREIDLLDGSKVEFGDPKHIASLESEIRHMEERRNFIKTKIKEKGSGKPAEHAALTDYTRLLSGLRAQLRSAINKAEKNASKKSLKNSDEDSKKGKNLLIDDD